jgi:hypothetical protein
MGTKPNPPIQPDPNNPSPLPPKTEPIPATEPEPITDVYPGQSVEILRELDDEPPAA